MDSFQRILADVKACTLCQEHLPWGTRPVIQCHPQAKILIAGQAPGKKVHESGIPFDDASGNRLRDWLGMSPDVFYDPKKVAILPMGFCYPGTGTSGDRPPRPECAPAWRQQLLEPLKNLEMTLVIGKYAQDYHFPSSTLPVTDRVKSWRDYWPAIMALPHPSPRNNLWLRKNPWFESELLPVLKQRVCEILNF